MIYLVLVLGDWLDRLGDLNCVVFEYPLGGVHEPFCLPEEPEKLQLETKKLLQSYVLLLYIFFARRSHGYGIASCNYIYQ